MKMDFHESMLFRWITDFIIAVLIQIILGRKFKEMVLELFWQKDVIKLESRLERASSSQNSEKRLHNKEYNKLS